MPQLSQRERRTRKRALLITKMIVKGKKAFAADCACISAKVRNRKESESHGNSGNMIAWQQGRKPATFPELPGSIVRK